MSINALFRTEGKLMWAAILLPLAIGLVAAIVMPNVLAWLAVDKCLDAGGKYDYENNKCIQAPAK